MDGTNQPSDEGSTPIDELHPSIHDMMGDESVDVTIGGGSKNPNPIPPRPWPKSEEERLGRHKANVRAAQARYHAKKTAKIAEDKARLEALTAEVKKLENDNQETLLKNTVATFQSESKDEILGILRHPNSTAEPSHTRLIMHSSTPSTADTQQCQEVSQSSMQIQPSAAGLCVEYGEIPTSHPSCEIEAVVVNKLQEFKDRHGSLPPGMMSIEAIKQMPLQAYANEWSMMSLEMQRLVKELASKEGGRDEEIEHEIARCQEKHIPFFIMAVRYNPQLFQRLVLNSPKLCIPGSDAEEKKKYLVDYFGLTPSQLAKLKASWQQYENQMISAQNAQNKVIQSLQVVPTVASPSATSGEGGSLEDFSSMQEVMGAYCSLIESTAELELWQKKKLLGTLQVTSAVESVLNPMQRAKLVSLCAPNFPDVLTFISTLA